MMDAHRLRMLRLNVLQYVENVALWWGGWQRFGELSFKPGWHAEGWAWKLLYGTDYLAGCLIFAGPVTSVSRYWQDHWFSLGYHGMHAGPDLWGTRRCAPWVRVCVPACWVLVVLGVWVLSGG